MTFSKEDACILISWNCFTAASGNIALSETSNPCKAYGNRKLVRSLAMRLTLLMRNAFVAVNSASVLLVSYPGAYSSIRFRD